MPRAAVVFALIALAVSATASGATAGSSRTVVHYFHAFQNGKIAPGLRVQRTVHGFCTDPSWTENRRFAWRCGGWHATLSGVRFSVIGDPCFSATAHGRLIVCPASPWSSRITAARLSRPLPRWTRFRWLARLPWGLWLVGGKRCKSAQAAAGEMVLGKRATFYCSGGGLLIGFPDRHAAVWTIKYARNLKARHLTQVAITDAWW